MHYAPAFCGRTGGVELGSRSGDNTGLHLSLEARSACLLSPSKTSAASWVTRSPATPRNTCWSRPFDAAHLDWRFLTFEVPAVDFEGALRGARIFGFRGVMLAPPHRARVLPYLEELGDAARISGQVNCVAQADGRLRGYNTEGRALRHLLEQHGPLTGAKVTVIGAGRVAKSIAAELASVEVQELAFVTRRAEETEKFAARLTNETPLGACAVLPWDTDAPLRALEGSRVLINATPLGRPDDGSLKVSLEGLVPKSTVADVLYNPPHTPLLARADESGFATVDGLTLLIEQAALAFEIWTGASADRTVMREAVEEFLVL